MKRMLLSLATVLMLTFGSNAATFKADEVGCINRKALDKYMRHQQKEEFEFTAQMEARAVCYINRLERDAAIVAEVGDALKLELADGHHMVWVKAVSVENKQP